MPTDPIRIANKPNDFVKVATTGPVNRVRVVNSGPSDPVRSDDVLTVGQTYTVRKQVG